MAQLVEAYAKNRKVACSTPDVVTGFSHWLIPSGYTIFLQSTRPLTQVGTRNIYWGWRRQMRTKVVRFTTFIWGFSLKSGDINLLEPYGLVIDLYRSRFTLTYAEDSSLACYHDHSSTSATLVDCRHTQKLLAILFLSPPCEEIRIKISRLIKWADV